MAKKGFIKDQNNIEILPITRGELIIDSSGNQAFHSTEFLATDSQPGLMSPEEKIKLSTIAGNTIDSILSTTSVNPVQNKVVTVAINEAKQLAIDAQETANDASENVSKVQQIVNVIKESYLKSATVNGNVLTIVDQSDSEITFTNTTYNTFLKETAVNTGGRNGLVPKPDYNDNSKTRFLREDGTWVIPTYSNTTYTFANGTDGSFTVTPSDGSSQKVTIGKPATAGTADKVSKALTIKINTGDTEDTNIYTYDGSKAKTLDIKNGTGIGFTNNSGSLQIYNSGVRSIATGTTNGTISVNTNGTSANVAVKGLGSAAYTASTDYAVRKTLTNEDLNDVITPGFYNAGGSNTVTNKPSDVAHFGLEVIHGASGSYYVQILYQNSQSNSVWRRHCQNGTWSDWTKDKLTDTTYSVVSSSANGLAPKVISTNTATVGSAYYVLASTNGSADPSWYKLPANAFNDDTKVTQTNTTGSAQYRVLLSGNADDTTETTTARKSANLLFNPSTGNLKTTSLNLNGDIVINDGTNHDRFIKFQCANSDNYGWRIGYLGAQGGDNNDLTFDSHRKEAGWASALYFKHTTLDAHFAGIVHAPTFQGNLDGTYVNKLTGYKIANAIGSIAATDSLNTALGKLEFKTDFIYNDLFGTDNDDVINKWHEIVDFVDSVAEGTDITDEFVTRKTEQTITGEKIFSGTSATLLTIDRNSTNPAWIKFAKNNNLLGYIGIDNDKKPVVNIDGKVHDILHSNNSFIKDGVITINGTSITPLTSHQSLANYVTLNTAQTISGIKTFSTQQKFTVAQGTAPFTVTSTTKVTNLNVDYLEGWHKDYFQIGYDGSRHYRVKFASGQEDLNWKTVVKGSSSYTAAPTSDAWQAATVRGYIWYSTNNYSGGELRKYPFCAVFKYVSGTSLLNTASLYLPQFARAYDCIRIVRISTNSFELQVRQISSWQVGWIEYQMSGSGTKTPYTTLQTAGSGTVVVSAADASILTEDKAAVAYKVNNDLTFAAGAFAAKTYNGSAAVTVNVPTKTSHLTNDSGFITSTSADDKYVNVTGDTMTGALTFTAGGVIITTSTTSNYKQLARFYKGASASTTYTYDAQIGWHNTGDGDGAIILAPYAVDDAPWNGSAGLYISKTRLLYKGQTIVHSGNYASYLGYIGTTPVQKSSAAQALTGITNATLTGHLITGSSLYQTLDTPKYGINLNNSDIIGTNSIYFYDKADGASEGLRFYRDGTKWDTLTAASGVVYFNPNSELSGGTLTPLFSALNNVNNTDHPQSIYATIGGTTRYLKVDYAQASIKLTKVAVSDPNTAYEISVLKWYSLSSTNSGNTGYAGTSVGFPVTNNANGILWLGTHSSNYGGQLGVSSNGRLYYRFITNNSFPTTADGGSWNRVAWTSEVNALKNYYWADIKISSSSNAATTPTFATATVTTQVNTPKVHSTGRLTLNATSTALDLKFNNDNTKSVILNGTQFKPYDTASGNLDLGSSAARWKGLYSGTGNFTGDVTLYASSGASPRLIFQRGELNQSSVIDWCIYDTEGDLLFQKSQGNGWETIFRVDYDTNNSTVVGNSNAAAFIQTGTGTSDFSKGTIKFDTINIPTTSGGTTYGAGTNGQVLKSNGTTVYWASDNSVTQTVTTTSNTSWRPILVGYSYSDADPFAPSTVTNTVYATHLMKIKPSTGALWASSTITASGFVKSDSSNSYVLLGGGSHKALSDFAMASAYVKKAGDTMTGRLTMSTTIVDHDKPTDQCLVINSTAIPEGTTLTLKNSPGIGFHIANQSWGSLVFNGAFSFINSTYDGYLNVNLKALSASTTINANSHRFNYGLAYYNTNTLTVTGTIVITLPNGWNSSMNTYEIDIYEYTDYDADAANIQHSKIIISGYNYSTNAQWIKYGYQQIGSYNKGVRLGYNGSKCCILLGTTTTTWSYPQVHLSRVITGYNNQTEWSSGYSISVITSESGYSKIVTASRTRQYFSDVVATNFRGTLIGNASTATQVCINNSSGNSVYPVIFTNIGSCGTPRNDSLYVDSVSGAGYNPSTNAFVASVMTAGTHNSNSTLYLDSASTTTSIIFRHGSTERMRIAQPEGYVGIGTTSPSCRLDVNGVFNSSNYQVGDALELKTDDTACQTTVFGSNSSGYRMKIVRQTTSDSLNTQYSPTLVLSSLDTHAYIAWRYDSDSVWVGAGSANKWKWRSKLVTSANYGSYLGYIGTTAVQTSSAAQALTGITTATISTSVTTPLVTNSGVLTLNGKTNIYLKINDTDSQAINFASTYFKPFGSAKNLIDLGVADARWKGVYANTGNFSSTVQANRFYLRYVGTTGIYADLQINTRGTACTTEGTAGTTGITYLLLGNSTAVSTTAGSGAENALGILRIYGSSSGYTNIRTGTNNESGYTLYLPGANGQFVYHTNDTQIGAAATPVYITADGAATACTIAAGSSETLRPLMVTNTTNGMYYTPSITASYTAGTIVSSVSSTDAVRHTCTNSNGSVSLYTATNRGLYDTTNGAWIIYLTKAADHVYIPKWASKGGSTTPVYFNSSGEPVACTSYAKAIKAITRSGTTFTYTCIDGTTGTFTQQDNNTTYDILVNGSLVFTPAESAITNDTLNSSHLTKTVSIVRGSWNYAGNGYTAASTWGNIDLAGTTIIKVGGSSSGYTQLFITPNTASTNSALKGEMLYYIDNGDTYTPTWYRVATSANSSVSGGGNTWGSSITVKINGTSKTLTIPSAPSIPTVTDYYWANVKVSASSNSATTPTFSKVTISYSSYPGLLITRSGSANGAIIGFANSNGTLGGIGMSQTANGGLKRYTTDYSTAYTVCDTGNTSFTQSLTSGTTIGTLKIAGTSYTLYCQTNTNTDTKVTQSQSTTASYRPLVLGYASSTTAGSTDLYASNTNVVYTTNKMYVQPSTGYIYAVHYYESSDATLKTNIKSISDTDNIPTLREFDWKETGKHSYGFIAQELEQQGYSELVDGEEGHKTVNYTAALALTVGKLQNKIKELEKEIENLKNKN